MSLFDRLIVVIEDDSLMASLVTATLGSARYAAFCTADPDEGFRLACAHRPAAVILDLPLNDVRSGAVHRRLQSDPRTAAIPIILLDPPRLLNEEMPSRRSGARDLQALPRPRIA